MTTAYSNTFIRHEVKYLLTEQLENEVLLRVSRFMTEDKFTGETISSLYCDSDDDILIRASLDKPAYKEKLRLRAYNTPENDSPVFLEIKKKFDGTVYKRRAAMTCEQAYRYLQGGVFPPCEDYNNRQVMREIDWIVKRDGLKPRAAVFYDRRSFYGNDNRELRLTLDSNVRYRLDDVDLRNGTQGISVACQPYCVMEIKSAHSVPLWLAGILTEMRLYPGSFSKYGSVYCQRLSAQRKENISDIGERICLTQ